MSQRTDFDKSVHSAIKIQSIWRAHRARKTFLDIKRKHLKTTQDKERIDSMFDTVKAAIKIQAIYRGYRQRKKIGLLKSKSESTSAKIKSRDSNYTSPKVGQMMAKEPEIGDVKRRPSIDSTDSVVTVIMKESPDKTNNVTEHKAFDLDNDLDIITDHQNKLLDEISGKLERSISNEKVTKVADGTTDRADDNGRSQLVQPQIILTHETPKTCSVESTASQDSGQDEKFIDPINKEKIVQSKTDVGHIDAKINSNKNLNEQTTNKLAKKNIEIEKINENLSEECESVVKSFLRPPLIGSSSIEFNDRLDQVKYTASSHQSIYQNMDKSNEKSAENEETVIEKENKGNDPLIKASLGNVSENRTCDMQQKKDFITTEDDTVSERIKENEIPESKKKDNNLYSNDDTISINPMGNRDKSPNKLGDLASNTKNNNTTEVLQNIESLDNTHLKNNDSDDIETNNLPKHSNTCGDTMVDQNIHLLHTSELHDRIIVPNEISSYRAHLEADTADLSNEKSASTSENKENVVHSSNATHPQGMEKMEKAQDAQMNYASSGLLHTSEMHDSVILPIFDLLNHNAAEDGQVRASSSDVTATAQSPGKAALAHDDVSRALSIRSSPDHHHQSMANDGSGIQQQDNRNASKDKIMEAEAATKIQAGFRGYKVRKQLKLKNNPADTETPKRSSRSRTSVSTPKDVEEQSAVKIQAGIRGFLVRRRQRKNNNLETTK